MRRNEDRIILAVAGLLLLIFLTTRVTLTIKQMTRLKSRAMTGNWAMAAPFFSPRILGFFRMQRSSLAV